MGFHPAVNTWPIAGEGAVGAAMPCGLEERIVSLFALRPDSIAIWP